MENRQPIKEPSPELHFSSPSFSVPLQNFDDLTEGDFVRLECRLQPVNDPNLIVEWFHNGDLVRNTSRMKAIHDFGLVVLELFPTEPQDNGIWLCRATNAQGKAEIQCEIKVIFCII
jgi:titin